MHKSNKEINNNAVLIMLIKYKPNTSEFQELSAVQIGSNYYIQFKISM